MAEQIIGLGALNRRLNAIGSPQAMAGLMKKLAASTVRESKLLVPRKTGNLGRSIHAQEVTESRALIVASANYAAFVEKGTRAHEITPRARLALRFAAKGTAVRLTGTPTKAAQRAGGAWAFAKRVHHPGTKPHPFLMPGAKKAVAGSDLRDAIIAEWNGAA